MIISAIFILILTVISGWIASPSIFLVAFALSVVWAKIWADTMAELWAGFLDLILKRN